MSIWSKLLLENERHISGEKEVAWSYCEENFSAHTNLESLNYDNLSAIILKNGVESGLLNGQIYFERVEYEKYYLLIKKNLNDDTAFLLKNYWTLIVSIKLNPTDIPFVLVHMASSLDGKISTNCGHSKWIGNQENLIHAHRLRAIVDGIMVGSNTVKCDNPKLNVRHVDGKDPVRLILSNNCSDFTNLADNADVDTYLLRGEKLACSDVSYPFDETIYFKGATDKEKLSNLMIKLGQKGVRSILIEGGARTVSSFISVGLVNVLQLHMAPIVLGSGRDFVSLPEITTIQDGLFMKNVMYTQMGDSMMITGRL